MKSKKSSHNDLARQIEDIFSRYELVLPFAVGDLLGALEELDNPYELNIFLKQLHGNIAASHGDELSARVMPEISAIHAKISRSALGDLSYNELESELRRAQTTKRFPDKETRLCHAGVDMTTFLIYVRDNEPTLTPKLREINRKSVSEINALMVEPQVAIHDYGKVIFTDRNEHDFWKICFLRSLAQTSHMIYVRDNRIHLSKRGASWLELDEAMRMETLFRSWCETADWGFWNYSFDGIVRIIHSEQLMVYQAILALNESFEIVKEEALDSVCATLCGIADEPDDYGHRAFSYVSRSIIIRPLAYFGLVSYLHDQNEEAILTSSDVALTKLGTWMLQKALREKWSWVNKS